MCAWTITTLLSRQAWWTPVHIQAQLWSIQSHCKDLFSHNNVLLSYFTHLPSHHVNVDHCSVNIGHCIVNVDNCNANADHCNDWISHNYSNVFMDPYDCIAWSCFGSVSSLHWSSFSTYLYGQILYWPATLQWSTKIFIVCVMEYSIWVLASPTEIMCCTDTLFV